MINRISYSTRLFLEKDIAIPLPPLYLVVGADFRDRNENGYWAVYVIREDIYQQHGAADDNNIIKVYQDDLREWEKTMSSQGGFPKHIVCPLCGEPTKDYFLSNTEVSDIKCANKKCFFSSNYVPARTWRSVQRTRESRDIMFNKVSILEAELYNKEKRIEHLERLLQEGTTCTQEETNEYKAIQRQGR